MRLNEEHKRAMAVLGFSNFDSIDVRWTSYKPQANCSLNNNLRELRKLFKKRCLAMLPEKHPTVPNAHSKFEEVITAFVQVKNPKDHFHSLVKFYLVDRTSSIKRRKYYIFNARRYFCLQFSVLHPSSTWCWKCLEEGY